MSKHRINGPKLIQLRKAKNWSQRALAEFSQVSKGSIEKAETTPEPLRDTVIAQLANALKVTPEELWDPSEHADPLREQFAEYLAWQRDKLELARLLEIKKVDKAVRSNESIPKVEELFVEPYLLSEPHSPEETPVQWKNVTLALTLISEPEPRVILGDPGSGKSTLATYLTLKLAQPHPTELSLALGNRLPLLFILNSLKLSSHTTWDELLEAFRREMCPQSVSLLMLQELLRAGQAVLIFDGLDELGQPERWRGFRSHRHSHSRRGIR